MDLSTALTQDLAALAATLPPVLAGASSAAGHDELTRSVALLHDGAALAVTSMLGLTITMTMQGQDVTLTSMNVPADGGAARPVAASLRVPLTAISVEADGVVTLYAGTPGAFVDLAADLTYELGLDQDRLVLDQHLTPAPSSGITGARELSVINTAVGILIGRGFPPQQAEQELRRLAAAAEVETSQAARQLVDEATAR